MREEQRTLQAQQCFDTKYIRISIKYTYHFIPGDLGFGAPAQASSVLQSLLGSSGTQWQQTGTTTSLSADVASGNAKWNENFQKVLTDAKFRDCPLARQQSSCFTSPTHPTSAPTAIQSRVLSAPVISADIDSARATASPTVPRTDSPTRESVQVYVRSLACMVGPAGFLNSSAPTTAPTPSVAPPSPEPSMTNTPPPIAWPTQDPTRDPTPAPTNELIANTVASAGSGTIAGIAVGSIVVVAILVIGAWYASRTSGTVSKEEEGIMKRYMDMMAKKQERLAIKEDEEGKEEGLEGDAEPIDTRKSFADSIAEIYSPRWSRKGTTASKASSKNQPFLPYVSGESPMHVTAAGRHMSVQMTPLRRETALDLNPEIVGAEEVGVGDAEFGLMPQRDYSFNPMSAMNNNAIGIGTRRGSTNLQSKYDFNRNNTLNTSRRASAALTQSYAAPGDSNEIPVLQSRHASVNLGVGGAMGMKMQLAGRSGALAAPFTNRRLSAVHTGISSNITEPVDSAAGAEDVASPVLTRAPEAPTPPVRRSVYHTEAKGGPSKFTLGNK